MIEIAPPVIAMKRLMPARNPALWFFLGILSLGPSALSAQTLAHRYSFFSEPNGSTIATDVVASANGTLQGSAAITGGQLVLNGASGSYLNLPSGIVNNSYSAVTIETWASFGSMPVNCFFWGLGNTDGGGSGEDYIFCAPKAGRVAITGSDPGYTGEQNANSGADWSGWTNLHIVAIYNPPAGQVALYTNGVLAAVNPGATTPISSVNDVYSYIGRSLYTGDPYAPLNVAEFRVWNGALSAQQVALDAASGPAQLITNPGALLLVGVAANSQMPAGGTQQAAVTGNFANVTNVNLITYAQAALTSDNTNVLTVSPSGLVTSFATGTANLIGTYGGLSATQSVTVAGFVTNQFVFDSFGDGFWAILNQGNRNALTASFSGASQETFTNGATDQQIEVLYNLQNGTFRLRQHSSWYCLGASNNTPVPGGGATLTFFFYNRPAQQWYLVSAGSGFYRIFNAASNLVLQTDNGNPAQVTLAPPSGSPFQLWQFVYQTHFPKKGCAGYEGQPYQGEMQTDWAYNYDDHTTATDPAYFNFVPMVHDASWEPLSDLQSRDPGWLRQSQPAYLLTYNEPDNASQANMTVSQTIALWPSLQALNVPLVGPAMQNEQDSWENSFYQAIATNGYRVDYTAVHLYVPPNASSVISDLQSEYNAYGRPVWLTEFSPVDWSGNQGWTEDDDYNFLAEFMWMAEGQEWFKRYAIFPFSGSNPNPPYVSVTAGYRGNFFQSDGSTLTPYGELYSAWDGNTNLQARTPYFIHNLATSFRLTSTNSSSTPVAQDIYWRDASAQWALLPAPTTNHWYIISLNDGRRLQDSLGSVTVAPVGTTGSLVEWTFTGPDSKGYYFIGSPVLSKNLNASGTPPAITFSTVSSATQNNNTRWRLIKPYQPVSITAPTVPGSLSASAGNQSVTLNWTNNTDRSFNVYRSTTTGGPYTRSASVLTNGTYVDSNVTNGVLYFYVVTGLNLLGEESGYSSEAAARPVSTSPTSLNFSFVSNILQFNWPLDHTGWGLQVQTNSLGVGLSTNWIAVPGSSSTNLWPASIDPGNGCVFYRLVYPSS
jgi:hypothetical protein